MRCGAGKPSFDLSQGGSIIGDVYDPVARLDELIGLFSFWLSLGPRPSEPPAGAFYFHVIRRAP